MLALAAAVASATPGASADGLSPTPVFEGRVVARVELLGRRHTLARVIWRELHTCPGAPLSLATLRADVQRLDNLDIFSSVRTEVTPLGPDSVRVAFRLRELPPVVPYLSYDVTDQDGWSFGPAVKAVNLMGRDLFVAGYALFGGRTSFLLDLSQPWLAGDHLSFELDVARTARRDPLHAFDETSLEITPRVGRWIGAHGRASVAASYLRFEADRPGHTLSPVNVDDLLRLGASVGWDSRDTWSDPGRGWLNELELWKTGAPLPGEGDFWTANLDAQLFQPALAEGHTLVLAGLLTLQSGAVGRDLPGYMGFQLGGANSLRGYTLDDLARERTGTQQLLTTIEYRVPLVAPREVTLLGMSADLGLGGTLFVDGGLAWTTRDELDPGRARIGAGAGLRVLVPAVDMVRLDVGAGADGWAFHVASYSKMRAQRQRLR